MASRKRLLHSSEGGGGGGGDDDDNNNGPASKKPCLHVDRIFSSDDDDVPPQEEERTGGTELLSESVARRGWMAVCDQFSRDTRGMESSLNKEIMFHASASKTDGSRSKVAQTVKRYTTYPKTYAAGMCLLAVEPIFCFHAVSTEGLHTWSMLDLAERSRHFLPLIGYCSSSSRAAERLPKEINASVALQIYNYPLKNIAVAMVADYEKSFQAIFEELVEGEVLPEDVEAIERTINADSVMGDDARDSANFSKRAIERMQTALRQYRSFWYSADKRGPKELLACIISLILFVRETSLKCVYTRMRIDTKFRSKTFPLNQVSTKDGDLSTNKNACLEQMCRFMHEVVQNQSQARRSASVPEIDNVPFIQYNALDVRYIYRVTAILCATGRASSWIKDHYAACSDVIMSSFSWVCSNYRRRGSLTKDNESNISYRKHVRLYLDEYRLIMQMLPMGSKDHSQLKSMLHDNFRGGGASLAMVVREGSSVERYLIARQLPLHGRTNERVTKRMKLASGITASTPIYMTGHDVAAHYKRTLSRLSVCSTSQCTKIIADAQEMLSTTVVIDEIPDDTSDPSDFLICDGDDDDDDGDDDGDDAACSFGEVLARSKETARRKPGGQRKSAEHHARKKIETRKRRIDDGTHVRTQAVTLEKLGEFNTMITYHVKNQRTGVAASRKAYDEYYKELTDKYSPTEDDDLCLVERHLESTLCSFSAFRRDRKKEPFINSVAAARSAYIGLLLKFAIKIIAPRDKKSVPDAVEWYRVRKHPILDAGYKWIVRNKISLRTIRDIRRYLAVYDLATMNDAKASWVLHCGMAYTTLVQRADYLYTFFRYDFVLEADPLRVFEIQEFAAGGLFTEE